MLRNIAQPGAGSRKDWVLSPSLVVAAGLCALDCVPRPGMCLEVSATKYFMLFMSLMCVSLLCMCGPCPGFEEFSQRYTHKP